MFFLQSVRAPYILGILGEDNKPKYFLEIPRYTLEDGISYGAVLAERWRQGQTKDMTDNEVRNFNVMNPPYPLTPADLKVAVQSMEGAKEVIGAKLPEARVFAVKRTEKIDTRKGKDGKPDRKFRCVEWVKGDDVTTPDLLKQLQHKVFTENGLSKLSQVAFDIADLYDLTPMAPRMEEDITDEQQQGGEQDPSEGQSRQG